MLYVLILILALATAYVDRRRLKNKKIAAAYIALYVLGLGIAVMTIANRDLPGPMQLIHSLMDPVVQIFFRPI